MTDKCCQCEISPVYNSDLILCKDCNTMFTSMYWDLSKIREAIMIKKLRFLIQNDTSGREIDYVVVPYFNNYKKNDRASFCGYKIIFKDKPLQLIYKDQSLWRTL